VLQNYLQEDLGARDKYEEIHKSTTDDPLNKIKEVKELQYELETMYEERNDLLAHKMSLYIDIISMKKEYEDVTKKLENEYKKTYLCRQELDSLMQQTKSLRKERDSLRMEKDYLHLCGMEKCSLLREVEWLRKKRDFLNVENNYLIVQALRNVKDHLICRVEDQEEGNTILRNAIEGVKEQKKEN
jgi:hypothetical protein